jgi:phosphatidylglycerophosphate synthase
MKSYTVILISRDNIGPEIELMGISAYRICAEKCAKYFETDKIFVPALEKDDFLGGISILSRYPEDPEIEHNLVIIDSALLFEGKFLWRMRNRFNAPLAAFSEDLKPLGFAILTRESYSESFFDNPWKNIDSILEKDLSARVIVIDTHYCRINSREEIKDAENFLLRSLRRQSDGIISSNLNRPLSIKLSKFLTRWNINPNSLTSISLVIGLIGSLQLLRTSYGAWLTGLILLYFSSILAGVDGETAKITLRRTEFGKWYNIIANDVVTVSFLGSLTIALKNNLFLYESGLTLTVVYLIYLSLNHLFTALSSLRKGRFFIQEIADKTQLNKNRFELFLSFFKRDIIIFSGLLLAIFNILEFLPPVFLIIFLTLFIIGVMKYFLQQSKRGLN